MSLHLHIMLRKLVNFVVWVYHILRFFVDFVS
jgi:hypothetical protein